MNHAYYGGEAVPSPHFLGLRYAALFYGCGSHPALIVKDSRIDSRQDDFPWLKIIRSTSCLITD